MFQTEELGLTCLLIMLGFDGKFKWEGGKCYFMFHDHEDLNKAVQQYYWTRGEVIKKAKAKKSSVLTVEHDLNL